MTSEQGEVSIRTIQSVCAHETSLFVVRRNRLQGVQRGYAQRTAMQTSLGDVIFDSRWFKIGNTRSERLESFLEAT